MDTAAAKDNKDNFSQKAAKFQANFQELKQKELNFQKSRTTDAEAGAVDVPNQANWPSFYPLLRHDLDDVAIVSLPCHALCKYSFNLWRLVTLNFAINFLLICVFFWLGMDSLFSLIYAAVETGFMPLLFFFLSHYPLYRGAVADKKILITFSIAGTAIEVALIVLMLVGLLEGAGGGVFKLLTLLRLKHWILLPLTAALQLSVSLSILMMMNQIRRSIGQVRSQDVRAEINQQAYNSVREDSFKNIRSLAKDILN
jgi:hypothetical protein